MDASFRRFPVQREMAGLRRNVHQLLAAGRRRKLAKRLIKTKAVTVVSILAVLFVA
jgi:hypothetical protein